jgi:hypothetical protein
MKKKEKKKTQKKSSLSEQFQNPIKKIVARGKIDTLNNKNTSHLPGLAQHFTKQTKTSYMGPTLLFPQVSTMPTLGF